MTRIVAADPPSITEAADILKSGGVVAMPTETVYGLAGNALDGNAIAKIYEAKGRPSFNPLIVHVASVEQALEFVDLSPPPASGEEAHRAGGEHPFHTLAHHFWPGPLTMILPRKEGSGISELATAGLETIALRMPAHPVAQDLLKTSGLPLAAPSANKSGSLSPTTPKHVADSLGNEITMILAAGRCAVGLESTVIDLSGDAPVILRPGAVTAEDIVKALNLPASMADPTSPDFILHNATLGDGSTSDVEGKPPAPKSPGQLLKHYAPDTPVRLNAVDVADGEALLAFGSLKFMGLKSGGFAKDLPEDRLRNLSETSDLNEAAANLFAMLKELDKPEHTAIAVMNIPETGLGVAINDRLRRAATSSNMD